MVGRISLVALLLTLACAVGCGARETDVSAGSRAATEPRSAAAEEPMASPEPPDEADEADDVPPPAPARPAAVEVEAGVRLGPVRIGMSEPEVRALGLEESEVDSHSRRFGPYRVFFANGAVRRVEAQMGDLERIRFGERVFEAGTDIHVLRDAFGACEWQEGGGERYRCAAGTLFVQTTHSLRPERYTLAVEGG